MIVYVLHDPGDGHSDGDDNVKVYQSKEKLFKDLVEEMDEFDPELSESARLLFDKGDYEDILDIYEEFSDVRLSVFETTVIK